MHEKGQTDEARRDLARLALVRKQREEAAQKRLLEKKGIGRIFICSELRSCLHCFTAQEAAAASSTTKKK